MSSFGLGTALVPTMMPTIILALGALGCLLLEVSRPALRRLLTFRRINLVAESWPIRTRFDVIFCRNVFIYFSDATIRRVAQSFAHGMPDDGYLFLGASESLTRLATDFELAEVGGAFVYVKGQTARDPEGPGANSGPRVAEWQVVRELLCWQLGGIRGLRGVGHASVEDLLTVDGISKELAEEIYRALH